MRRAAIRTIAVLAALVMLAALPAGASAATCTIHWDGSHATSDEWTEPTNWDTDAVPGTSDHVCVEDRVPGPGIEVVHSGVADPVLSLQATGGVRLSGGTLELTSGADLSTAVQLDIASGVLGGAGTIEVSGSIAWSGGQMSGGGTTRVLPNATLTHSGNVTLATGRVLEIAGLLDMASPQSILESGLPRPLVRVQPGGVVRRTTTTGIAVLNAPFQNNGLVEATSGVLDLQGGGGAVVATGDFGSASTPAGGVVLSGQTFDLGTGASFAGGVLVSGAVINAVAGSTVGISGANAMDSGDLGGTGTFDVSGSLAWSGGRMIGQGTTRVLAGGSVVHSGNVTLASGRVLEVAGLLDVAAPQIVFSSGAPTPSVRVLAGGAVRRSGAAGIGRIDVPVQNDGLVDGAAATLELPNFTNAGTVAVAAGATVNASSVFTNFSGTTLTGGSYTVAGSFRIAGANVVTNAAIITLDGPAAQILDQTTNDGLRNLATNAGGAALTLRNGKTLVAPGAVTNAGTLTVEGGSTFQSGALTSSGSLRGVGIVRAPVTSSGEVAPGLSPGVLTVDGDYTQTGSGTLRVELAGTTPGAGYDRLAVTGAASLAGALAVETVSGFGPAPADSFEVLTAASRSGEFGSVAPGYQARYEPTRVVLALAAPPVEPTPTPTATPTPTPTATPTPAPTPAPTAAPTATPSQRPRTLEDLPAPAAGRTVNVEPVAACRVTGVSTCTVTVKRPGGTFVALTEADQIPVGSVIDTSRGEVRLLTARNLQGATQLANFWAGRFRATQSRGRRPVAEMVLDGATPGCPRVRASAARKRRGRKVRRLWGDGKGEFRTRGRWASGGVRGTRWLLEDRCDATLVRVATGRVEVRDFVRRQTVVLRAGQSYLARARPGGGSARRASRARSR